MSKYRMYLDWLIDLLKWAIVFIVAVLVFSCNFSGTPLETLYSHYGVWLNFLILLIIVMIFVVAAYFYSYVKTYLVYHENLEESYLIGRATHGMDHKGRTTRRVIMHFKKQK